MNDLLSMNSPLDRLKAFGGKSVPLRDKSRATLPYYCSRSDLKSSSSLSSVNPGRTSLGNPVFSSDNMSKDSDSKGAIHPMKTNTVSPKEGPTKKHNSWCRDQPLERKTISQPVIPDNPDSRLDTNSRSLHFINFKNIDDDDDYDEVEIPTQSRLEPRHVMLDNYSTPNDESASLLPQQAQDKTEEDGKTSAEVLSSSSDQLQSQSSVTRAKSKWNKIRTTVKMAGAFSPTYRKKGVLEREDSFLKRFSTRQGGTKEAQTEDFSGTRSSASQYGDQTLQINVLNSERWKHLVIGPNDTSLYGWLSVVTITILYNLWTCIAREAFSELPSSHTPIWIAADLLCDVIYLLDIFVQFRTGYLEHGLIVYKSKKLFTRYVKSRDFTLDLISLFPLDLLQFYFGVHPILRFPRFIKAYRLVRFVYMVETRTAYPNMWRVANLSHTIFLGCHWFAAFYFLISKQEQFYSSWGYPKPEGELALVTQKYLRSLYWSTLTLTTIGDLPPPETSWEFVFTIVSYLIGVFVFATIVGQVGNVITNRNASRQEFEKHLDAAKAYMRTHNVPSDMQKRVQRWYDYAWSRGRMNGGGDINSLGLLPDKLKTELALHVNLETLKKVTIFHECEPEFLHDLVLKMKAFIFTPGDLICRKGEVAREMFIIADGLIEVVSDSGDILKQMSAGDFFGEIGILNLDGVNKRTADVRSVGYSELFVLSRDDVLCAFKDHPEAEKLIKNYGRQRLQELDEHKKKTANLARKFREKASARELQSLLSRDMSPTSGSEGLLSNCSSASRPLVTKEDKWLSLTANLLKQARMSVSESQCGVVASKDKETADAETSDSVAQKATSNQPFVKPDESTRSEGKNPLRFSNWKTKWKEQRSKKESTNDILNDVNSDNYAPSLCLLPTENSNNNNNNNNINNNNISNNNNRNNNNSNNNNNSIVTSSTPHECQTRKWTSPVHLPKSRSKLSSDRETVQESGSLQSPGASCLSSSQMSAFAPTAHASRGSGKTNKDDIEDLCDDVTRAITEIWRTKFAGKLRTCEELIMRLEEENRRQQEVIENLQLQLKQRNK